MWSDSRRRARVLRRPPSRRDEFRVAGRALEFYVGTLGATSSTARTAFGSDEGARLGVEVPTSAAFGLSTCAAYSRGQNQSFGLAEGRRRLIWWSRTLDKLATVEMCP